MTDDAYEPDKPGWLRLQGNGRWVIERDGRMPHELSSGSVFRVMVRDTADPYDIPLERWAETRIEYDHANSEYYSVDGHKLYNGRPAKPGR